MRITINGKEEIIEKELTLHEFLENKNIRSEIVVIELNNIIIDKDYYKDTRVKDNDKLEIIHFIGGG